MSTSEKHIYQIGLNLDINGIPHSANSFYIDGQLIGVYGFAPENGRSLVSSGAIHDDSGHQGFTQLQLHTVTEDGFINALDYVKESYANPPEYNLPFGVQCAIHSNNVLAAGGVGKQ